MRRYPLPLLPLLPLLVGCGPDANDAVEACIAENPPTEPFDVGSTEGQAQPSPVPGGTPILSPAPTAADIARDCRDDRGSGCNAAAFISKPAAICIARERGLELGQRPWDVSLGYYEDYRRVCWSFLNVIETSSDGYWGDSMVLDAVTGAELGRSSYRAIP